MCCVCLIKNGFTVKVRKVLRLNIYFFVFWHGRTSSTLPLIYLESLEDIDNAPDALGQALRAWAKMK